MSAKADGTQLLKQKQALFDAFFNEIQPFVTTEQLANIRTDYDSAIAKAKDRIQQGLPRR